MVQNGTVAGKTFRTVTEKVRDGTARIIPHNRTVRGMEQDGIATMNSVHRNANGLDGVISART